MDIVERLKKAAFDFPVIDERPDGLLLDAEKEIERLRDALRHAAAALDEASVDLGDWGTYADEYMQKKYDLRGDVEYYERAAALARELVTPNADVTGAAPNGKETKL